MTVRCPCHRTILGIGVVCAVAALAPACAGTAAPVVPVSPPAPALALASAPVVTASPAPVRELELYRETGVAGWYGKELQGKKTASGEIFDMYAPSAAHRTLPLGTVIRVTNLDNFKSIKVAVNDRGPFVRQRVLDLSYGAARELGFVAQGTARVKIETLEAVRNAAQYTVVAATYTEEENARMLKDRLLTKFEHVTVVPYATNFAILYRVRVGSYAFEEKAELVASKLTSEGLEPVVVRKE